MLNYIILGMLYNCSLTGYDLKKRIENGVGVFYKASYGSIYPCLKTLLENGMVTVSPVQQGARQKKVYEITPAGRESFLKWLAEPIKLNDREGTQNHLAKVYFFDNLPPEVANKQLIDYEQSNTRYLHHLLELKQHFDSCENHKKHYYMLSTLYYGIAILNETIRWCKHTREKLPLQEFLDGGTTYE